MVIVTAAFLTSVFYSLPSNVLATREGEDARRFSVGLAPQSWAFFTRDPDSDDYDVYQIASGGNLTRLLRTPNSKAENMFGLSRIQRAQGVELGTIGLQVSDWLDCTEEPRTDTCKTAALERTANTAKNTSKVASVCGEVLLVAAAPTPWPYRELTDSLQEEHLAARVHVTCPERSK